MGRKPLRLEHQCDWWTGKCYYGKGKVIVHQCELEKWPISGLGRMHWNAALANPEQCFNTAPKWKGGLHIERLKHKVRSQETWVCSKTSIPQFPPRKQVGIIPTVPTYLSGMMQVQRGDLQRVGREKPFSFCMMDKGEWEGKVFILGIQVFAPLITFLHSTLCVTPQSSTTTPFTKPILLPK